jgi:hypothetical protein
MKQEFADSEAMLIYAPCHPILDRARIGSFHDFQVGSAKLVHPFRGGENGIDSDGTCHAVSHSDVTLPNPFPTATTNHHTTNHQPPTTNHHTVGSNTPLTPPYPMRGTMAGRTFKTYRYEDNNDILNLHDVEDYSNESIISGVRNGDPQDQLPSVEDAKLYAGRPTGLSKHPRLRNGGPEVPPSYRFLAVGISLILLVFGVSLSKPLTEQPKEALPPPSNRPETYEQQWMDDIALDPSHDFQSESSYQSLAKQWLLQDDKLLATATRTEVEQRYALYCLLHATQSDVPVWTHTRNIPECHWDGVTCQSYEDSSVVSRLNVRHVHMQGDLPPEMLLLTHLRVLNINSKNEITSVPEGLCDIDSISIKGPCGLSGCECCSACDPDN